MNDDQDLFNMNRLYSLESSSTVRAYSTGSKLAIYSSIEILS